MAEVTPDSILQIARGLLAAKHLFVANEVGLCAQLAAGAVPLDDLAQRLFGSWAGYWTLSRTAPCVPTGWGETGARGWRLRRGGAETAATGGTQDTRPGRDLGLVPEANPAGGVLRGWGHHASAVVPLLFCPTR
jgi:hypothetical protein